MKATRLNFYRSGMEPESSGQYVRVKYLPASVQAEFVEEYVSPEFMSEDDDD